MSGLPHPHRAPAMTTEPDLSPSPEAGAREEVARNQAQEPTEPRSGRTPSGARGDPAASAPPLCGLTLADMDWLRAIVSAAGGSPPTQSKQFYDRRQRILAAIPISPEAAGKEITNERIKHMVDRFLGWKLPENFRPDGGVEFDADAGKKVNPRNLRYTPYGTNLLDATQATAMVRYMLEGLPPANPEAGGGNPHHWTPNQSTGGNWRCTKCGLATMEIASSATPERCSVIVTSSPPSPEAGGAERPADAASALELLVVYMAMEDAAQATHCERLIKSAMRSPAPEAGGVIAEAAEFLQGFARANLDWANGGYGTAQHAFELRKQAKAICTVLADLSTKDAENARLRGAISTVMDEMRGDPSLETEDWQRLLERALNPTKGAGR